MLALCLCPSPYSYVFVCPLGLTVGNGLYVCIRGAEACSAWLSALHGWGPQEALSATPSALPTAVAPLGAVAMEVSSGVLVGMDTWEAPWIRDNPEILSALFRLLCDRTALFRVDSVEIPIDNYRQGDKIVGI